MAVAQLVESRIVIPVVVGSSPISHPKQTKETLLVKSWRGFLLSGSVGNWYVNLRKFASSRGGLAVLDGLGRLQPETGPDANTAH